METPIRTQRAPEGRHYDNDWLNVLAMLVIFLFHCARFFNFEDWHVKNNQLNAGMSVFVSIVAQWIMPLFFMLSGISSNHSLGSRSIGQYIVNRFKRLFIPLSFGTFVVIIPLQVWVERVSHSQFNGSFIEFYPHYFNGLYAFGGNFAWMGLHLWYLEMLFVFSILTLPLFFYLKKERSRAWISQRVYFLKKIPTIYLFGIPVFIVEFLVGLQPEGAGRRDFGGWSLLTYLIFFLTGFLTASDPLFRQAMEKLRFTSLLIGCATTILMFGLSIDLSFLGELPGYSIRILFRSFNALFWLMAILGFGSRHLSFNHNALKYAREAVLPFYVLHQTVIVVIGFYIADGKAGVMMKYLFLSSTSFILIVGLYQTVIRRFDLLRFFFGMDVRRRIKI
jgi:glucans biosynthesis protein C